MDDGDSTPRRTRGRPRDWHDKTEQNTIKSLDRAMQVLERLGELGGTGLSALADDLGQSPATVYRVLVTLEGRGIVEFNSTSQLWNVGAGAFLIGSSFLRRTSLVERARPILRDLMEATGETANLGIVQEGAVLFVSQVETHATIRAFFPPGTMSPLHASGIGKALLAQMPDERLTRHLKAHPLTAFTPHTLTQREALIADLAATRTRGYSIDAEEKTLGMRCIAAPIFDVHGEAVAGLSVSGPTSRVEPSATPRLGAQVIQAAQALTRAMGGHARHGSTAPPESPPR
ncbi:HTH-type transcriptional regulator BhcR [Flavimaricola marinus]|nr:HTH-type transcriptional regulator BhcR [Flavimaricola marinus]